MGHRRLGAVFVGVAIVRDKPFLPQPDFDDEIRQLCWPATCFQCLCAQRGSHVVECFAEVHGHHESRIRAAPTLLQLALRSVQLLLCMRLDVPLPFLERIRLDLSRLTQSPPHCLD